MHARASTGKIRQTYAFIKAHGNRFDIRTMCRVLEVAPSGYYAWLQAPVCQRALEDVRLLRLMRVNKIRAVRGYRIRHGSAPKPSELIPNILKRNFDVARPNKAWVTDITYIRTSQGWLYLAVVMDLFSRKIVGWSTRPTMAGEFALDAVLMAVRGRRPCRTVMHSDQGSQYGSDDWRRFCKNASKRRSTELASLRRPRYLTTLTCSTIQHVVIVI
jgi:putative transposase